MSVGTLLPQATASVGYDYILRQCRLRGRVDSNGAVAAYLEERLNVGVNFVLSAEARSVNAIVSRAHCIFSDEQSPPACANTLQIDHGKKDYKFGFGMTVGE